MTARRNPGAPQRHHPLYSGVALISAAIFVAILGVTLWLTGGRAFTPGPLSAVSRSGQQSGGFDHHAAFAAECTQCHVPFQSIAAADSAAACEACHTGVREARRDGVQLHGRLDTAQCVDCHTEHGGADVDLVAAALDHFTAADHAQLFPLDGEHAIVECADCHAGPTYSAVPTTCAGCHTEPETHLGTYGDDCATCHTPAAWAPAVLVDHAFALDHGELGTLSCQLCHTTAYTTYTCTECHTTERMRDEHDDLALTAAELADCAACHVTGTAQELEELEER